MKNLHIKQYFSGVAWSAAFRVSGIIATLWINILLTRLLSPDEVGIYFLIFSISMFFSLIARFGLKQSVVKIVSENYQKESRGYVADALRKIFYITSIGVIITCSVLYMGLGDWIAGNFFELKQMSSYGNQLVLWVAALAFLAPLSETYRGLQKYNWGAALDNSISAILMALVLFCILIIYKKIDLSTVFTIAVIIYGVVAVIGMLKLILYYYHVPIVSSVSVGYILSLSTPIFFINISQYLVANASLWVVGYFLAPSDVGVYGVVIKLFNLIALPLVITNMAIDPLIARLHSEREKQKLQDLLRYSAKVTFTITFFISLVLLLKGENILSLLFGEEYGVGYPVLSILITGNLINVWTGSCNNFLLMTFGQKTMMYITFLCGALGISLSIFLAPEYGLIGVAWAVAFSVALQNIVSWTVVLKKTGIKTNPSFKILDAVLGKSVV